MKTYGEYCPMALAAELVAERWTLLILRELAFGSSRFNDIHRGLPRISPALLTQRLRTLEQAGIIGRQDGGYFLSEAGMALVPVIDALAVWGKTWLPANMSETRPDPDLVMWDMHRRMVLERLPSRRLTLQFTFDDQPENRQRRWIVCSGDGAQFCMIDPGYEVDLYLATNSTTITQIWFGDLPLRDAVTDGSFRLDGPADLVSGFPSWITLSPIAKVPRRRISTTVSEGSVI